MAGGVDVERHDVGALDVLRIHPGLSGAGAPARVLGIGDALSQVQEHGSVRIRRLPLLVALLDHGGVDARVVARAVPLRVVRLVLVGPGLAGVEGIDEALLPARAEPQDEVTGQSPPPLFCPSV